MTDDPDRPRAGARCPGRGQNPEVARVPWAMRWFAPVLVAVLAWASGCGSSSGGGDAKPIVVSEETYAEALANAACSGGAKCCAAQGKGYDVTSCMVSMGFAVGFFPLLQAQAKALGLQWDQAAAEACVEQLRVASESCGSVAWGADQCVVYPPNVPAGSECQQDMQCIPPAHGRAECDYPLSGPRTCVAITFVGEGADCSAATSECDPEASVFCDATSKKCVKRLSEGTTCNSEEQCAEGLGCIASQCAKLLPQGATCSASQDCESGVCSGNVCGAEVDLLCK